MTTDPLIDLHRHLEGSIRVNTVLEIATRHGDAFADLPNPRGELVFSGTPQGLVPYLNKVDRAIPLLTSLEDWERVGREAVEDAYNDGLEYVEIRFAPWLVHLETGLHPAAVIDAVASGSQGAQSVLPLPVGLLGVIVRDLGPAVALEQAALFASRRGVLQGIDLAGNEHGYGADLFQPAFELAAKAGLRLTAHAGEAAGSDSIWSAINDLHVERVGHGLRAIDDPRLMEHLAERGITLDLAITSNVHTGAAASFEEHPLPALVAAGVPVTINTDDPRTSNVTLSHEHAIAVSRLGMTADQMATVAARSRTAAFR